MVPLLAQALPQVPPPWDPGKVVELAERSQNLWERGWQSATAAVLLAVFLFTLGMLLWTAKARNRDRKETETLLVSIIRESSAAASENGKQTVLFQHMLTEHRADLLELKRAVTDLQRAVAERGGKRS